MSTSSPSKSSELMLEDVSSIDFLRDEWSRLAEESGNLFLTPEWASVWWRHYGQGKELRLKACRDGAGRVIAILPFYLWHRRPRVLRFVGHGPGDELGPVTAPENRERAAACLVRALAQERGDILLADFLPGDCDWQSWLPGSRVLNRDANPVLELEYASWDDYLRSKSRSLREQVLKRERALNRDFEVRFRLSEPDSFAADVDLLFCLHRARWSKRPTDFAGSDEAFQRDFFAAAQKRGWLRLWFLELDEKPVAAWLGYRFAGVEFAYQAGRDPDWDRLSVGFVLRTHSIRSALEDGATRFCFLRGAEPYKYRFASRDDGLVTLALPRGATGCAALIAGAALVKSRRALRSLTRRG